MSKTNVTPQDKAAVVCPHCNMTKIIKVAQFKGHKHCLKLRCSCGKPIVVDLNFRRYYRKQVDLLGLCKPLDPPGHPLAIKIQNISLFGIGFTVTGRAPFKKGTQLLLSFELDDKHRTKLEKKALVVQVEGSYVGCSFLLLQDEMDKALGFYLRFA